MGLSNLDFTTGSGFDFSGIFFKTGIIRSTEADAKVVHRIKPF